MKNMKLHVIGSCNEIDEKLVEEYMKKLCEK